MVGVDGVGVNFHLFAILCRVCILLVFCALFLFVSFCFLLFIFGFCRYCFVFPFFVAFFFVSFLSFQEILVFSQFLHISRHAVDCPSVFGHGENCKNLQKREFRSDPVYTNPVRNFPSHAPFSGLSQALGWPMIRERIPLRKAADQLQKKIPQKIF